MHFFPLCHKKTSTKVPVFRENVITFTALQTIQIIICSHTVQQLFSPTWSFIQTLEITVKTSNLLVNIPILETSRNSVTNHMTWTTLCTYTLLGSQYLPVTSWQTGAFTIYIHWSTLIYTRMAPWHLTLDACIYLYRLKNPTGHSVLQVSYIMLCKRNSIAPYPKT